MADDRRWMVVDARGRFLTQREQPRLALVAAQPIPSGLRLETAGASPLKVALPPPEGEQLPVVVWRDTVAAVPAGAAADAWLSAVLGIACRLVHMPDPGRARPVDPAFGRPGDHVSFADGFPLLVTTAASLADLNRRLPGPVPMNRFRPNLVVDGGGAWDEDRWSRIRIGSVAFRIVKDCARCAVTTVDQDTAVRSADTEPLRTLATFRRKAGGRVIFGQNLVPEHEGAVRVGDAVEVVDVKRD